VIGVEGGRDDCVVNNGQELTGIKMITPKKE